LYRQADAFFERREFGGEPFEFFLVVGDERVTFPGGCGDQQHPSLP
jgi:hypothetical protein